MENVFCKIFQVGDNQVLVRKTLSEDSEWELCVTTVYDGIEMSNKFGGFESNGSNVHNAFDKVDQSFACSFFDRILELTTPK